MCLIGFPLVGLEKGGRGNLTIFEEEFERAFGAVAFSGVLVMWTRDLSKMVVKDPKEEL